MCTLGNLRIRTFQLKSDDTESIAGCLLRYKPFDCFPLHTHIPVRAVRYEGLASGLGFPPG